MNLRLDHRRWTTSCRARSVLEQWLGETTLPEFRAVYLQRAPFAIPSTAGASCELLDWNVLCEVLAAPARDVLVVARGSLVDAPAPRDAHALGFYLRNGVGLCVRNAELHHANLHRVAESIAAAFPGSEAHVQLFVTPAKTYGFSWHFDDEDVFIAQTAGQKDYYFRENTVAPDERARGAVFGRFTDERSTILTARLHAGDFLYIPAKWWHMAQCLEDSLSISVGVMGAGTGVR